MTVLVLILIAACFAVVFVLSGILIQESDHGVYILIAMATILTVWLFVGRLFKFMEPTPLGFMIVGFITFAPIGLYLLHYYLKQSGIYEL